MRKSAKLVLILITGAILCSCSLGGNAVMTDNDQRIANEKFEEILEVIQSENKERLRTLFSKESLKEAKAFDASVNELFDYFNGKVKLYDDWGGPFVETIQEDDCILQMMESTYDVETTECEYRFAIRYIIRDTTNINNVGIQSLYIIKLEDDSNPQYAYWGDGKNTPGININIKNVE